MRSADFQSARSLERFLRSLVLGVGASATACGWVPARERTEVRALPARTLAPDPNDSVRIHGRLFSGERLRQGNPGPQACRLYCGDAVDRCQVEPLASTPSSPSHFVVVCTTRTPGHFETWGAFGRRLAGVAEPAHAPTSAAEHYFRAACAETAAILSFQQLAFDLEDLGAPTDFVRSAQRSARDEAEHARLSLTLARRFDHGTPRSRRDRQLGDWPRFPRPVRRAPSLFEVALDNAVSGCATEAVGVWLQLFQAKHARDAGVRAAARRIASDEARHAALTFRVAAWCDGHLSASERRQIREAMFRELRALSPALQSSAGLADALGLPDREATARAVAGIEHALADAQGRHPASN